MPSASRHLRQRPSSSPGSQDTGERELGNRSGSESRRRTSLGRQQDGWVSAWTRRSPSGTTGTAASIERGRQGPDSGGLLAGTESPRRLLETSNSRSSRVPSCTRRSGRAGMEGGYQAAINRMGRATLGAFQSILLGIVAAESGLTPARPLLGYRQARFTQRLMARPQERQPERRGPEEILSRRNSGLTDLHLPWDRREGGRAAVGEL